jgi:antitoxin (DNA-binding transcriptional repressor) of toxin-antitoxin stability system
MLLGAIIPAAGTQAQTAYRPITAARSGESVALTGHDLTIDQVVAIARGGAKVALSADAKQRQTDRRAKLRCSPAIPSRPRTRHCCRAGRRR